MVPASIVNGTLYIHGTNAPDVVSVSSESGYLRVTENGQSQYFLNASVTSRQLYFWGYDGNDTFDARTTSGLRCIADGGAGDDTLLGGEGHDLLYGWTGNDSLYGGAGNDHLDGQQDNDWLNGQDGNDVLKGFDGDDTLLGESGNDDLDGGTGNDLIYAGSGNDVAHGGGPAMIPSWAKATPTGSMATPAMICSTAAAATTGLTAAPTTTTASAATAATMSPAVPATTTSGAGFSISAPQVPAMTATSTIGTTTTSTAVLGTTRSRSPTRRDPTGGGTRPWTPRRMIRSQKTGSGDSTPPDWTCIGATCTAPSPDDPTGSCSPRVAGSTSLRSGGTDPTREEKP